MASLASSQTSFRLLVSESYYLLGPCVKMSCVFILVGLGMTSNSVSRNWLNQTAGGLQFPNSADAVDCPFSNKRHSTYISELPENHVVQVYASIYIAVIFIWVWFCLLGDILLHLETVLIVTWQLWVCVCVWLVVVGSDQRCCWT